MVKLHFGGSDAVDDRSALEVIAGAYAALSPQEILENKLANLRFMLGNTKALRAALATGEGSAGLIQLRRDAFFRMSFALFIPTLALPAIFLARVRNKPRLAGPGGLAALIALGGILGWLILMFGPPATIPSVHQGSLFLPLAWMAGMFILAEQHAALLSRLLLGLHALTFLLWIPFIPTEPDHPIEQALLANGFQPGFAALALLALAGMLWLAHRADDVPDDPVDF